MSGKDNKKDEGYLTIFRNFKQYMEARKFDPKTHETKISDFCQSLQDFTIIMSPRDIALFKDFYTFIKDPFQALLKEMPGMKAFIKKYETLDSKIKEDAIKARIKETRDQFQKSCHDIDVSIVNYLKSDKPSKQVPAIQKHVQPLLDSTKILLTKYDDVASLQIIKENLTKVQEKLNQPVQGQGNSHKTIAEECKIDKLLASILAQIDAKISTLKDKSAAPAKSATVMAKAAGAESLPASATKKDPSDPASGPGSAR